MRLPPRLKVGERVRLAPGGPVCLVERVSFTGAYVRELLLTPRLVELPNGRSFYARTAAAQPPISAHAFVERVPEEEHD